MLIWPIGGSLLHADLHHDKAFDVGLLTISEDFSIVLSPEIKNSSGQGLELIKVYEGKKIHLPKRFIPDQELLDYHRKNIFKAV